MKEVAYFVADTTASMRHHNTSRDGVSGFIKPKDPSSSKLLSNKRVLSRVTCIPEISQTNGGTSFLKTTGSLISELFNTFSASLESFSTLHGVDDLVSQNPSPLQFALLFAQFPLDKSKVDGWGEVLQKGATLSHEACKSPFKLIGEDSLTFKVSKLPIIKLLALSPASDLEILLISKE